MTRWRKDSDAGPMGIVAQFLGGAFFGGFVSFALFAVTFGFGCVSFASAPWVHVFWIIPVL